MANVITNVFLPVSEGGANTKQVSLKESMEWKNIFEKSMRDIFTQNSKQDYTPQQQISRNQADSRSPLAHQTGVESPTSAATQNTQTGSSQSAASSTQLANQSLPVPAYGELPVAGGLGQLSSSSKSSMAKLALSNQPNMSYANLSALQGREMTQALARLHLAVSDNEIKVYARNHQLDESEMLKVIKELVGTFNHRDYVISEIKYNGKRLAI